MQMDDVVILQTAGYLKQVIAKHIPKTCVKEINVLSYRYFNAENKKHLILGTTNKPHLAMKLVSPMQ